ncbi:MAG: nucleotidyltransferase domain-containing protein [Treponema sp.]|jgi:predicted nucleotidyltransferase|nr:nucleotidyltransferase domain-containing protein [Treponema sp.]
MASNIETVTVTARNYARDVKKTMPVTRAVLFGSYRTGNGSPYVD